MRSLSERFRPKVTPIEKSKDIDSMRIDELVDSIQTYEMTLPSFQKFKDFAFKAFKNEEKDAEIPYDITRDELAFMAKRIKRVMKFNKRFHKNQEFGKWKGPNKQSPNEKGKGSSKGKKVECFTFGGLGHYAHDCPSPKDIKKSIRATWNYTNSEESVSTTSEDVRYDPNDLLAFITFVESVHDSDYDSKQTKQDKSIVRIKYAY